MTSSKKFGRSRLLILLAGATLMSLALALASSTPARADDTAPDSAWFVKGPAPTMIKATGLMVAKQTGLKVTVSPSHDDGKGGPVPLDLPFGPNVQVWNDPAEQRSPSLAKDPVTGITIVAFQHFNGADWDIYIGMSTDDGATWTVGALAASASNEKNPSLAVTSTGTFAVAYENDVDSLTMDIWQSYDGATWNFMGLAFLPTSPFSQPAFPNVATQQGPPGTYPDGVMFAWQAFCNDVTNCGGGSYTTYWYGSSDWSSAGPSLDLGGSYWLTDPVRVDRFGLVDVLHPSAGWSSAGYFMGIDDEGYTAAERRSTWLILSEDATSATNEWIQNAWSQDAQGCYPAMAASGQNVIIISTILNNTATGSPTNHVALFFSSNDGWNNPLNADWVDANSVNQRGFSIAGTEQAGTTYFHMSYYGNSVVTSQWTDDVGQTWNGPIRVSDNPGTGVNDYKATSLWLDTSATPKVAWQDNRDGNLNIYTTGYVSYPIWINATCGGVGASLSLLLDDVTPITTPFTGRMAPGSHTIRVAQTSQQDGFCKRCEFVQWSDGTTTNPKTFTVSSPGFSITAEFSDTYRVQLSTSPSSSLDLTWKGVTQPAQIVAFEAPGTYNLAAPSPQAGGLPTERYVFANWSDGSTLQTRTATVGTACLNLTANFAIEYQITVQTNPPGLLVGMDTDASGLNYAPQYYWITPGTTHMLITKSPQPDNPVDTRVRFDRWAGGPNTWGWNQTMNGANTYTANFVTQYLIQIRANFQNPGPDVSSSIPGCDIPAPAPLLCWADENSSPNLILNSPQVTGGSRYVFVNWNDGNLQLVRPIGPIIAPAVYVSIWTAEYRLTMVLDASCMGTITPSSGWYQSGANVNIDWTAPTGLPPGERYRFKGWVGIGNGNYTGANPSQSVAMNDAITETAYCYHEFQITLDTSPVPLSYTVGITVVNGQNVYWWEQFSVHWFNVTQTTQGGATTRYVFADWSDLNPNPNHPPLTVTESKTFIAQFDTQYKVTLNQVPTSPAGIGDLACDVADCWYDSGTTTATVTVTSPWPSGAQWKRYVFSMWGGDAVGTTMSYTFSVIDAPKTATANWLTQYKLTVTSQNGWGNPACSNSDCWYQSGSQAQVTLQSPVDGPAHTRYVFTMWSQDASGTARPLTITMDSDKNVTANWKTQYELTVTSVCGSTPQCGAPTQSNIDGWYDSGATATVSVTSPASAGGKTYNFKEWTGDGTGTITEIDVLMDAPKSITATWDEEKKDEASDLMVWIILIVVIIIVVVLVLVLLMKRKKGPAEEELPPEEIPPVPPSKPSGPGPARPASAPKPVQKPVAPPPPKK